MLGWDSRWPLTARRCPAAWVRIMHTGRFFIAFLAFWTAVAPSWAAEPLCCLVCLCGEGVDDACVACPVDAEQTPLCGCCAAPESVATVCSTSDSSSCPCGTCEVSPPQTAVVSTRTVSELEQTFATGLALDDGLCAGLWTKHAGLGVVARAAPITATPLRARLCVWVI
jgi:hypothetical protein